MVAPLRLRQWLYSVYGEGVESSEQHGAVQAQYLDTLQALEPVLALQVIAHQ